MALKWHLNGILNGTLNGTQNLVLKILKQSPSITQKALLEQTNIPLRTIKRAIQQLKKNAIIERIGSDRKGYWQILK